MSFVLTNLLSGLTYGMLLFLMAAGLSIIYGLMRIINLAHGSFFILASYVAYTFIRSGMNFWIGLVLAVIVIVLLAFVIEKFLISKVQSSETDQVLLTLGLIFVLGDLSLWIWGGDFLSVPVPGILNFSIEVGEIYFPAYRLFVLFVGILFAVLLWYFENKTKIGMVVRAGVDDMKMVSALGFNIKLMFTGVFLFGAGLAAIGGVLGGPILGMYPTMEYEILVNSLIVVIIGGLGSWKGAFIGAILVGLVDVFGKLYVPTFSMALIFVLMVVILMFKPTGLFGRVET
ncbi:branched-chain amino acid ABC transporter permease [Alteribacillus iranensis]|uniref:Amino acid/amide ABC transporter membrane protein 1, HAAT family n=1 Tax=Alteribacillus iranensis TaxID=930128 RepID=A0A1I2F201_9BACI|nr:branched-chain amino acid ABC transporter permease [Alteribacillus iranensis]SFE98738.1 amino acid/amide ABC transporter membrane protein 1, HAAT family [Alteribacillus iranensis]